MAAAKQVIQDLYDAFARGDAATVLGTLHPTVRWMEAESGPLAAGNPYSSPQAVGEGVFGPILQDVEGFQATPADLVAEGSDVVAFGRYTGTHRGTGRVLNAQFVHRWSVEGGKVVSFQQYTDTAQWNRVYGTS